MPRLLRFYLLACFAFAYAYLVLHAWEPLRLNVGDPWLDAELASSVEHIQQRGFMIDAMGVDPLIPPEYRPTHVPPLAEITYGAMGKLGVPHLGAFRQLAIVLSGLAMWLLFGYARRMWSDTVALVATALFSTSVLWMMFADSLHRAPGTYAFCFLALWGLVRVIETGQRRHGAALIAGSFACWFAASDDRVLLVVGALFTIYTKLGNPFARGNRRFAMLCAAGCIAGICVRWFLDMGPVEWRAGVIEWQASVNGRLAASLATLLRRYSLLFTPMFWVTLGYTALRVVRAPSLTSLLRDGVTWLVLVAALSFYASPQDTASPMLRAEPLLPFYAIGSAILIAQLLDRGRIARALAIAWIVGAPVWAFAIMLSHPRSVLDRADVAKVRSYLSANDRSGFVMSSLLSDGPIQAAFGRLSWPALEADDETNTHPLLVRMLDLFETAGVDHVHAVIFTTPDSRFVDRSVEQLLMRRRLPSVTGWPHMVRSKANAIIRDYDRRVIKFLEVVGAERVLRLSNFDVYRIDRPTVLELAGRSIPVTRAIDFSSFASYKHKLLGWGEPKLTDEEQLGVSSIEGHGACTTLVLEHRPGEPAVARCDTVLTGYGLAVLDRGLVNRAQLMIRVERACDLRLTLELASPWRVPGIAAIARLIAQLSGASVNPGPPSLLGISLNDFTDWKCEPSNRVSFLIPRQSVRAGVNVVTFEKKRIGPMASRADVMSLAIEPICVAAP